MKTKRVIATLLFMLGGFVIVQAQSRGEIKVPDLDGYVTLKCDFHIHSVFSDGLVWPTVRLDEAYREGLDAIALTEHIEYRPYKNDIVGDHNRSFELSAKRAADLGLILIKGSEITRQMPPGHFNAIFLSDSNPLETDDYKNAFSEAKKQKAFIFWNHPGWDSQQPDTTLWWPEHTMLYNEGLMNGIEVSNGSLYTPEALQWCLDKNLAILGTSDIHQPIQTDYNFWKGEHRTMTFVFSRDRSIEGIHEALSNNRTVAYQGENVIGREELLRPFFEKSLEIKVVNKNDKGATISLKNKTDLFFKLKKTAHDPSLVYFRDMTVAPHSEYMVQVSFKNNVKGGKFNFEVINFIIKPDTGLPYSVSL